LTLSALGLYGTLAQRVSERSRELGVRLALGASPGQVARLVIAQGAALVGGGVALGIAIVWVGVPLIRDSLFGVAATDAGTYATIAGVLALTTAMATLWPSRTASRMDPVKVLKD
jgi:ABC-type antimicrobial peptide transport system permease subunit